MKSSRKKEKRARKQRGQPRDTGRLAALGRYVTVAAGIAVFAGLAAGLTLGAPRAQLRIAQRVAAQPVRVSYAWPEGDKGQSWLPQDIRDEILALSQQAIEKSPDPFSAEGLRGVAEAARGCGWISSVIRVERDGPDTVRVDAVWHTPAAVVRREGTDYLVAMGGEILPLSYKADQSPLKAVVGSTLSPELAGGKPSPGQVWPGGDVQAGLSLLRLVAARPWADQVTGVDVTEYLSRKELVLVTRWNGKIVWGGAPGDAIPGQLSTAVKVARLDALFSRYSRVDAGKRLVDVTGVYTMVEDTATANAQ